MRKILCAAVCVFVVSAVQPIAADSGYTLTLIPTLGGCCSGAVGINASGLVVGSSQITGNAGFNAILWDGFTLTPLPALFPGIGIAAAINDTGTVIAGISSVSYDYSTRATLWTNLIPAEIATLQAGNGTAANAMNAAGQLAGSAVWGAYPTAVNRAVFWPAPAQIVALPDLGGAYNVASGVNLD